MSITTKHPTKRGARNPNEAAAFGQLPGVRSDLGAEVVALGAVVVLAVVLAQLMGLPVLWLVAVAAVGIMVLLILRARRDRLRRDAFDPLVLALNRVLGARTPSRSIVQFSRWSSRWEVGTPERVVCRYDPSSVVFGDPAQLAAVSEIVTHRVGLPFKVDAHDPRRCRITLVVAPPAPERSTEEVRAERVVSALLGASAKIAAEVDPSGEVVSIDVQHDVGPKIALSGYRNRIERTVSSMLPGRWRALWDLEGDRVRFEVRPQLPSMILHSPPPVVELSHDSYKAAKIPYATDEDGNTITWVPKRLPHMLIIGGTGSGKTSLEHTLVTELAARGWRVWVLDGKRIEFIGFRSWPNVELVASRVESQVRMIHAAHELMEQRYDAIERGRASVADFEPLAVVIDEFATFKQAATRWYRSVKERGMPAQAPAFDLIGDIARLGRTAKVHLVVGIQRPDVTFLDGEMRDNFAQRVSLGRLSPQGAVMMWDSPAVGVVRLPQGQGVTLNDAGEPVEVLCHYTPNPADGDPDDEAVLDALRPDSSVVTYQRMMVRIPEPVADLDGKSPTGEIPPTYHEVASARIVPWSGEEDLPARAASGAGYGAGPDESGDASVPSVDDPYAGYGEPTQQSVDTLEVGVLVEVDSSVDLWAVVTSCEPDLGADPDGEETMAITHRDLETGEEELLILPANDVVAVRHPQEEEGETNAEPDR